MSYQDNWARETARKTRKSKSPTPEQVVQKAVIQWLKAHRFVVRRINTGGAWMGEHKQYLVKFGEPGHSDLLVELPDGRNAYIEVKAPDGRLTDLQQAFLDRQRTRGCPAFVVHSVAELEEQMAAHDLWRSK